MALLTDLPVEIHHQILSFLPSHRDVAALSIQCRSLHAQCDMIMRKKYRRVRIDSDDKSLNKAFATLMEVLKRPSLGRETGSRGVYIAQALTALLISVSPDLESLATPPPFFNYTGFYSPGQTHDFASVKFPLERMLRQVNSMPNDMPFLQNLRHVYVINGGDDDDGRFYVSTDFIGAMHLFHHLPSIEMMGTDILEEDENGSPKLEPGSSNISRVAIHHSSVDIFYLTNIICSCKTLSEFQYSIGGRTPLGGGTPIFNPKTLLLAILLHRETLEVLDVDADDHVIEFGPDLTDAEWDESLDVRGGRPDAEHVWTGAPPESLWEQRGSLQDFPALKRLSIGINSLIYFARGVGLARKENFSLADCLPPNLECLVIRGYQKGECEMHDAQINSLVAQRDSGLSSLAEIRGITECIPLAEDVGDPDDDEAALWEREEEWSSDSE
ncbi:hypothetical protein BDV26DRAFT_287110 [Aspergillus bertholletiae]|uniref:F-box domain-containing protein n=1 Tax=Aspergillus bertholletiae TaxID=1226010 RepID=A0A5N7APS6_9EURO|nr:hypothetical protein BDV26DRAFT_287110 [Aspergillus bertholletiae]